MKNNIYILLLFLLMTACTKELGELAETEEPRLVVNALITAGVDNQTVYFAKTGKTAAQSAFHTQFEIRVNDKIVCDSKSDLLMGDRNEYTFSAKDIKPGDMVSISAKNGGLSASAEVEVPQPVIITGIDTMTVLAKQYSYSKELTPHTRYLVHLRLPSDTKKDETKFFRVQIHKDINIGWVSEAWGDSITKFYYYPDNDLNHYSYSQDPALTENENNLFDENDSDIEVDWLEGNENEYRIFRSAYFKDGEYTLRLDLPQRVKQPYGWYQNVKIRIFSISHIEYNYLQALTSFKIYEPGVITYGEPLMPTNITGGAGIFCVESYADAEFFEAHDLVELVDGKLVPVEW